MRNYCTVMTDVGGVPPAWGDAIEPAVGTRAATSLPHMRAAAREIRP